MIKQLAQAFIERSKALGYKGKKRDDAAIDYFVGAIKALRLADREVEAKQVETYVILVLRVRGFKSVEEAAAE